MPTPAPYLASSALCLALVQAAAGQCYYSRSGQPDFDQRRAASGTIPGLPGNGSMYCVPTAAVNVVGYIANHGYPGVMSGPRNWSSNTNYNYVTGRIATMGSLMSTDASDGTGGANGANGLMAYLVNTAPGKFVVCRQSASGFYAPTPQELAVSGAAGALVNFGFGWYSNDGTRWTRSGGHYLTLTQITNGCSSSPTIRFRDPATDSSNLSAQSGFTSFQGTMQAVTAGFRRNSSSTTYPRTQWRVPSYSNNGFIDSFTVIFPIYGLTTGGTRSSIVHLVRPSPFTSERTPQDQSFAVPSGAQITDLETHPSGRRHFVLTAASRFPPFPAKVWSFDPLTGVFGDMYSTSSAAAGPMVMSRQGELYLMDDQNLKRLSVSGATATLIEQAAMVSQFDAMTYDDATDHLLALNMADHRIVRTARVLAQGSTSHIFPTTITLTGDGSVLVNPADGHIFMCGSGGASVYEMILDPASGRLSVARTFTLPGVTSPRSLTLTEDGHLMVVSGGALQEFEEVISPVARFWRAVVGSQFAGRASGGPFRLARSRTDFDPATMEGPDDIDILPTNPGAGVPDCNADFNLDGQVNVQDFLAFLSDYAAGLTTTDFNFDGAVNVQDYLAYLQAYAAGCA
jgi:hypothetical protein